MMSTERDSQSFGGMSMKEIPMPYVKANQAGIVLFVLLTLILQQLSVLLILFVIQIVGFIFGAKANLFIVLAKPFLKVEGKEKQAMELAKFNNSIAIIFLTISLVALLLEYTLVGYLVAGMLGLAALIAICGYCIGCTIYYQYKQLIMKRN